MNYNNNVGLINFGNTCFMNASIQLLMCAKALGSFLLLYDNDLSLYFDNVNIKEFDIYKYIQTYKDYISVETNTLGPKILFNRYKILNTNYIGFTQEDSHEFLTFTLDDILEQIKYSINQSILNEEQKNRIINEVRKIFSIKFLQTVFYKNKNETSKTIVYENILTLPISDDINTLEDAYEAYKTQDEEDFTITYKITELPKYLFIGLKRFKTTYTNITKITKEIDINLETNIFGKNYKLKGFIMHDGSVFGGHYYTYASRKIGNEIKWFCYNDLLISEISLEQIIKESKRAYLFLYSLC